MRKQLSTVNVEELATRADAAARLRARRAAASGVGANPALDALSRLAADVLEAPVAFVSACPKGPEGSLSLAGGHGLPDAWTRLPEAPFARSLGRDVADSGAPVAVSASDEGDGRADPSIRAYLGVPARGRNGRILGVVATLDRRGRRWSEPTIARLEEIAITVGLELENASAVAETEILQRRARRVEDAARRDRALRAEIGRVFTTPDLDHRERFSRLLDAGRQALDVCCGAICKSMAGHSQTLYRNRSTGEASLACGKTSEPEEKLRSFVLSGSDVVAFHDAPSARKALHGAFVCAPKGRYIAAPLATKSGVFGLLEFWSPEPRRHFWTEGEIAIVSLLGMFVSAHLAPLSESGVRGASESLIIDQLLQSRKRR